MHKAILLGIVAVTILGTVAVQGILIEAQLIPIETLQVDGIQKDIFGTTETSSAQCPTSHPFLIGGSYSSGASRDSVYDFKTKFDTSINTFEVTGTSYTEGSTGITFQAHAVCANFNIEN